MRIPLAPPPGLNSDDTTFAAQGRWADGNNVRFRLGSPEAIGASTSQFTLPSPSDICRNIFAIDRSGTTYIVYGQDLSLYIGSGLGTPADRTPVAGGFTGAVAGWCFAAWGSTLLACPAYGPSADPGGTQSRGPLLEQSGSGAATEVTQAPDDINYMIVTQQRQVLALGCNEEVSTTYNGKCIRGSDLEDYTDWTTTATNNAFEHILDGEGNIVAGANIGSYVAVWTTTSLHLGTFIGDPSQTYRFDRVADHCGLLGVQAFTVVDQVAYWVGTDLQFRRWTPGGPVEIIQCPIWRDFVDNFNASNKRDKLVVGCNSRFQEIWAFYNDTRDVSTTENSRYIAFNYTNGEWFRGQMGRTAWIDNGLVKVAINSTGGESILTATAAGAIHIHDKISAATEAGYIQTADQYLDEGGRRMMIRSAITDFEGASDNPAITLTVYVRDRPMSTAVTKGPYTLTPPATKKDFRASGMIVAAKFTFAASNDGIRLGKTVFDVVPMGER